MILTKDKTTSINLDFEIELKIKSRRLDQLLLIVPTNRKLRALKKEIISISPGGTTGKLNLETIGTFSQSMLFLDSLSRGKVLSEAAATILLKQSFLSLDLKYFSNYKNDIPSGTLERIKNVISEYKKHGITPAILRDEAKKLTGSEKKKALDISDIYEEYLSKCLQLSVKEIGDVYAELNTLMAERFEEKFRQLYPTVDLIIINGFDELTSPEISIINSISNITSARAFISFDYYAYNPLMFSHLDKCYANLKKNGFTEIKDLTPSFKNKFQSLVREKLFLNRKKNIVNDFKEKIEKLTAPNREKEIEIIAKEIKDLITEEKVEPNKICLVFNLISKYSPLIRDVFPVYGIPFNLTDRISLSESSPVVSFLNFLEIQENDFYYKNILRALSGGFIKISDINLSNLHRAAVNLKIISGFENWTRTLENALKKYNEYDDENEQLNFNKKLYKNALKDLKEINKYLSPFKQRMRPKEFLKEFLDLIYLLNLPGRLINSSSETKEENIKSITTLIDTVTEIIELLEKENKDGKKYSLKYYLNIIRTAVASSRFNIKEKPNFGVQITTMNEIRGLKFDYLFIAGLCDGDFPTRYMPEIFFSGSFTKNDINHQTEERYHFYQSLCAWDKKLYLSYPIKEEKKELVESNFLTEFSNLFETSRINYSDFENKIYSKEEYFYNAGKNFDFNINQIIQEKFNLNIEAAININNLRTETSENSEYAGYIYDKISPSAKQQLEELSSKPFSITKLESYALCPYQYFAQRVLKLKPMEEPSEEIEALEMGSLMHEILYEFYTKLREKNIILQNSSDKDFAAAFKIIFDTAKQKLEQNLFDSPLTFYEKEKILGIDGKPENSILYRFLELERESVDGYLPEFFEFDFGSITNEDEKVNIQIDEVNVIGKIDRIDIDRKRKQFKVTDYKIGGKTPDKEFLNQGLSLQLPLYLYAAKELIKVQLKEDFSPGAAEIYSLKFSKKDFKKNLMRRSGKRKISNDDLIQENEELIEICLSAIKKYVKQISEGKFHLSQLKEREDKVCRFCSFKPICRIQEMQ